MSRDPRRPLDVDSRGVFNKFGIRRRDRKHLKGGKHYACSYFVIDLDHDENATAALLAYAESCEETLPLLADDLREAVEAEGGTLAERFNDLMERRWR